MFRRQLLVPLVSMLLLPLGACVRPSLQDISPDLPAGTIKADPSPSGLTVSLAGNSKYLYAVSLNAGIWRRTSTNQQWQQLLNSPRRAYSIAVDPENPIHLVTGEREDSTLPASSATSGIWESFNAGDTWQYVLNPLSLGCPSQAISSVVFSSGRSLFAGTTCGVVRRVYKSTNFTLVAAQGTVASALAATPSRIWARNVNQLLFSNDAGNTWQTIAIPDAYIAQDQPYSLAASGNFAYTGCCAVKVPPSPCGSDNTIAVYNSITNTWALQPRINPANEPPAIGCSGTGLGGSLFLRGFLTVPADSRTLILFDSSAQEIYESTPSVVSGLPTKWTRSLGATCPECTNQNAVHSDLWDFLYEPPAGQEWVSNDGGVYQYEAQAIQPWRMINNGLHTHHIHTLTLMTGPSIAYPTSDNDAWFSSSVTSPSSWHTTNLGDVNWSAGDFANPQYALVALHYNCAALVSPATGSTQKAALALTYDEIIDNPEDFKIIQSLPGDNYAANGALDAVMLVHLPLHFQGGTCGGSLNPTPTVPGDLGNASYNGQLYLIRNRRFDQNPDINQSKGQGWTIESAVPSGATRFWVAGGHVSPVYYVYAMQNGQGRLYRQPSNGQWQEVNVLGNISDPTPYPNSQMVDSVYKGPVFVNPYNSAEIYVLTATGTQYSEDSGSSFQQDTQLTQFLTAGSTYPLSPGFAGDVGTNVRMTNRFDRNPMGALADMAFRSDKPSVIVAASPYTGVFCKCGGGWTDLNQFFDNPIAPISSVAVDSEDIYFATEGRGLFRIIGYQNAPFYSWLSMRPFKRMFTRRTSR
jgi:hypothetical protein